MTKYEKLSAFISGLALLVAISSPIVTYFLMDPELRQFSRRGQLQVSAQFIKPNGDVDTEYPLTQGDAYAVAIINVGQLSAKDIRIVTQNMVLPENKLETFPDLDKIKFNPPVPYHIADTKDQRVISIDRPLAPQESITLVFEFVPSTVVVSNEFGESTTLRTNITTLNLKRTVINEPKLQK